MADLRGHERELFVKKTFSQVAQNYVCMNHLMTAGMDMVLRKEAICIAQLNGRENLLDIGTGTGDLAREASRRFPDLHITAADFSMAMMTATHDWTGINRGVSDALTLPFGDEQFDVVVSGYLVRNVTNLQQALDEQYRVLKPGGRIVVLDTTRPRRNLLTPLINFYFRVIIPSLGAIFSKDRESYTYLIESTENFVPAEVLADAMWKSGFRDVHYRIRMFGTMAIHTALK